MDRRLPVRLVTGLLAALSIAVALPCGASAAGVIAHVDYPGMQHLRYRFGPIRITPGQNTINFAANSLKPDVPGYITRFQPNLMRTDGTVPRVDLIHLHHGVWLVNLAPVFAAGEEKTILQLPQGYGYHYDPSDRWVMNYMIHNLKPTTESVYVTYDLDFVPDGAPAAQGIQPAKPLWMDVAGVKAYPVFDVHRGWGTKGRYTFPDQARGAEADKIGPAHEWTVPRDVTLVATAGHLHPGGLWTDLKASRGGATRELFHSQAKYFEPAGAVSWDVSMTATKPDWRVALRAGDRLHVSATYDTSRASWYESMGIMVVWYHEGTDQGSIDPFAQPVDWHGVLTHGHLPENRHHGGESLGLPDARELLSGTSTAGHAVTIRDFVYSLGDLTNTGRAQRPPTVRAGGSILFSNADADRTIYHTITACRAPCNGADGIAYPLADGPVVFDSGELGYGPAWATPAANRRSWRTPRNLRPGTYTYFCRIHPFMRGSFRVVR